MWGKDLLKNKFRYKVTGPGVFVGTKNDSEEFLYRSEHCKTVIWHIQNIGIKILLKKKIKRMGGFEPETPAFRRTVYNKCATEDLKGLYKTSILFLQI